MSIGGKSSLRGEVWWMRLDPTVGSEIAKTRPCVVVTQDLLNTRRRTVVIIPISSGPKPQAPFSIAVSCAGKVDGVAVIDQIRAAAKERFAGYIGLLGGAEMDEIAAGMRITLGLI